MRGSDTYAGFEDLREFRGLRGVLVSEDQRRLGQSLIAADLCQQTTRNNQQKVTVTEQHLNGGQLTTVSLHCVDKLRES